MTRTVKLQLFELPELSETTQFTMFVPTGNREPDGGVQETKRLDSQMSLTIGGENVTTAPPESRGASAAMMFAGDGLHGDWSTWRKHSIRPYEMVDTSLLALPKEGRQVFYAQALAMMVFLERLCLARPGCGVGELATALESEQVTPERLFDWAAAERSRDLAHTASPSVWAEYEKRGEFSPRTLEALLRRAQFSTKVPGN